MPPGKLTPFRMAIPAATAVMILGSAVPAIAQEPKGSDARPSETRASSEDQTRCQLAVRSFPSLSTSDVSKPDRVASAIRARIERFTTRDYDKFEQRQQRQPVIYLEGASSSAHFHEVLAIGGVDIGGQKRRVFAVWSLAYGRGAHSSERVLSLLEYRQSGATWQPTTAGINLATYVGPKTAAARIMPIGSQSYVVEVAQDGDDKSVVHYAPQKECFVEMPASEPKKP